MSKNILITGPTSGIGRETAITLAKQGHQLFLLCRNQRAGEQLIEEISALGQSKKPKLLLADLGNFGQVKKAAEDFLALGIPLHVLINNAGIVNNTRIIDDGIEQMFRVNHLGHFLLLNLLLDNIKQSQGRIVVLASGAHAFCPGIQFDDINFEKDFTTFKTYGQSKLANMLMVHELSKRLQGSGVIVNSLHPGMVATQLGGQNTAWYTSLLMLLMKVIAISPKKGAETVIYLATTDAVKTSGGYYYRCKTYGSKRWSRSDEDAQRLWQLSEKLLQPYLSSAIKGTVYE